MTDQLTLDYNPEQLSKAEARAREALDYILVHIGETGHAPTVETLMKHFRWSKPLTESVCLLLRTDSEEYGPALVSEPGPHTGRLHLTKAGQQAAIDAKVLKV